jgi:predicted nucleic acid-binding protein
MYSWSHCSRASWIGVTGLMGVLLRAKRDGQIRSVKPELELLRSPAPFFVAPHLERMVFDHAGE